MKHKELFNYLKEFGWMCMFLVSQFCHVKSDSPTDVYVCVSENLSLTSDNKSDHGHEHSARESMYQTFLSNIKKSILDSKYVAKKY